MVDFECTGPMSNAMQLSHKIAARACNTSSMQKLAGPIAQRFNGLIE